MKYHAAQSWNSARDDGTCTREPGNHQAVLDSGATHRLDGDLGSEEAKVIARRRLASQKLVGEPLAGPVDVVRWFCAVQSQDYAGAKWALAQRTGGASSADIDALFASGDLLRMHVMRPTWHFVLPEDIRWLLRLTAPRVHAFSAYYYRQQELDDALFARSNALIAGSLQGGSQLTRTELAQILQSGGIPASGIRLSFLMMFAELEGIICSGGMRGKQFTYALLDDRAPNARTLDRDEALAELTLRYFTSHGPASLLDFAWWSGLTTADAKSGIERVRDALLKETIEGKTYWLAEPQTLSCPEPTLHLLPNFDEHLVAYKDHGPTFHPYAGNSLDPTSAAALANSIVRNGQIVGGWRRTIRKNDVLLTTNWSVPPDAASPAAAEVAATRFGAFVGLPVST